MLSHVWWREAPRSKGLVLRDFRSKFCTTRKICRNKSNKLYLFGYILFMIVEKNYFYLEMLILWISHVIWRNNDIMVLYFFWLWLYCDFSQKNSLAYLCEKLCLSLFYTFAVYLTLKITFHKLKHKKGKWGANIPENKYDDKCNQDIIQHNTNCQFLHNTCQECYQKLVLHSSGL